MDLLFLMVKRRAFCGVVFFIVLWLNLEQVVLYFEVNLFLLFLVLFVWLILLLFHRVGNKIRWTITELRQPRTVHVVNIELNRLMSVRHSQLLSLVFLFLLLLLLLLLFFLFKFLRVPSHHIGLLFAFDAAVLAHFYF